MLSGASDSDVEASLENQLESMIQHCDDELGLIPRMAGAAAPPPLPVPIYARYDHTEFHTIHRVKEHLSKEGGVSPLSSA